MQLSSKTLNYDWMEAKNTRGLWYIKLNVSVYRQKKPTSHSSDITKRWRKRMEIMADNVGKVGLDYFSYRYAALENYSYFFSIHFSFFPHCGWKYFLILMSDLDANDLQFSYECRLGKIHRLCRKLKKIFNCIRVDENFLFENYKIRILILWNE